MPNLWRHSQTSQSVSEDDDDVYASLRGAAGSDVLDEDYLRSGSMGEEVK